MDGGCKSSVLPGHFTVSVLSFHYFPGGRDEKRPELLTSAKRLIIHDLPLNMITTATHLHVWGGFQYLYIL